jgi:hypothetical protein
MLCPDCETELPDGTDVCSNPKCRAVLSLPPEQDLSELWRSEASVPELLTSAKPTSDASVIDAAAPRQPSRAQRRSGSVPVVRRATSGPTPPIAPRFTGPLPRVDAGRSAPPPPPAAAPAPAAPRAPFGPPGQSVIPTRLETGDPEANRGTQIVDINLPPAVRRLARQSARDDKEGRRAGATAASDGRSAPGSGKGNLAVEESGVSRGVDELFTSARLFYSRMHGIDRWTFMALALAFVGSFLPWSYVRGEGLQAGIQEYGVLSALAALLSFLCVYGRTARRRMTGLLLALQVLAAAALVGVPISRFLTASEVQFSYGLYFTAAGGVGVVLLTLARLVRFNQPSA